MYRQMCHAAGHPGIAIVCVKTLVWAMKYWRVICIYVCLCVYCEQYVIQRERVLQRSPSHRN